MKEQIELLTIELEEVRREGEKIRQMLAVNTGKSRDLFERLWIAKNGINIGDEVLLTKGSKEPVKGKMVGFSHRYGFRLLFSKYNKDGSVSAIRSEVFGNALIKISTAS